MTLTILITLIAVSIYLYTKQPSNSRVWSEDQAVLPYAEISGSAVSIKNIRNFKYESTKKYTSGYYDKKFDLNKIKAMYFVVEPFPWHSWLSHVFLSFEFEDGDFLAVSIEIRKKKGESFSPLGGFFRKYEIMYVLGDERDLIKLRSSHRKSSVFLYPMKIKKSKIKGIFLDIIKRVNKLKDKPEFYNTVTNNCITNIVSHVNKVSSFKVPFVVYKTDKTFYNLGLFNTKLSFENAKKKFWVNDRVKKHAEDSSFSSKIRE